MAIKRVIRRTTKIEIVTVETKYGFTSEADLYEKSPRETLYTHRWRLTQLKPFPLRKDSIQHITIHLNSYLQNY